MRYTIHLTEKCNLNCKYCYEKRGNKDISLENIKQLIDYEISQRNKNSIIYFYGGEPLLRKDLIEETINYINSKQSKTHFYYGITTNGTLLDNDFINYMKTNGFTTVAYSIDGIKKSQNINRITYDGKGTFDIVQKNAKKILEQFNNAVAMVVVTKNNLNNLDKNVKYLIDLGFNYINLQFDYLQDWQDEDLYQIKVQYNKVAEIYANNILEERDIVIPIIDEKIRTYVNNKYNCNNDCEFGMKTINVGTDGNFYPCMQFVNQKRFIIGNCKEGINKKARLDLTRNSKKENEVCKNCSINKRCKHTCECKNFILTENINEVSPIICETEKIFIDIADKIAEKLYAQNSKMFIQKFYNKQYNLINQITNTYNKEK